MNTVTMTILGIFIAVAGVLALICVTSCMLSGMISREEERQRYQEELCQQKENLKE